ncbi:MAG TPA: DUF2959 family protein [Humisphaera sp.]|nr:DUF2959 family protein [Humisphaera sp.]
MKMKWIMAVWLATLSVGLAMPGCNKEEEKKQGISAADQAAADKRAASKLAADKDATDKAIADKLAADKAAADKLAMEKATAVEKALADKAAADKAAADKVGADKAAADAIAAEKTAAVEKALADKAAVDKLVAEEAAAQAAAAKLAAQQKAEANSLPPDLVMMKAEMSQALSQMDLTFAKLDVLAATSGNLKDENKDAVKSIDELEASTKSVQKRATDMRDRGAAYFDTWDKQLKAMSTPEVAAIAAKRKDELAAKYAEVLTTMQGARAAFDPFWADMSALRDAAKKGVTQDTQKNFADQVKAARDKANTLKDRVGAASAELNQVSVIYTRP